MKSESEERLRSGIGFTNLVTNRIIMNSKNAIKIILVFLIGLLLFHFGILMKIIPYDITWGGFLKNDSEMYKFESVSVLIILFFGFILLIKGAYIKQYLPPKAVNVSLWGFFVLFGLNTIGNAFAETYLEKSFAILTLALFYLLWVILRPSLNKQEFK